MELKRKEFLVGAMAFAPFAKTFAVPKEAPDDSVSIMV